MYKSEKKDTEYAVIFPNNVKIMIDTVAISASPTLSNMFLYNGKFTEYVNKIYMEDINHKTFEYCIAYMDCNEDSKKINELIEHMDIDTLFDVICVSDYLRLNNFTDALRDYFQGILGNSVEEIREKYDLVNDFNESDNDIINNELSWEKL